MENVTFAPPGNSGLGWSESLEDTDLDGPSSCPHASTIKESTTTPTISLSQPHNIAIIPARIDSKRIPRKNIRHFCGKPIIEYPIRAALDSGLFAQVVVSSASDEVGSIAIRAGAVYHKRPVSLSGDKVGMYAVVQDVLVRHADKGETFDHVCMLYAASPFLTPARLHQGHEYMVEGFEFAFPMYKTTGPERVLYEDQGSMRPRMPYEFSLSGYYSPPAYAVAEGWWWAQALTLELHRGFWGDRNKGVIVPSNEVQVIDTEEDWADAERRYEALEGS